MPPPPPPPAPPSQQPPSPPAPYPLPLSPLLYDKVWGGDRLASLGKAVRPGAKVGESWELADMPTTSASGAGGAAARTLVATGPLAGKSILEAGTALGVSSLLGTAKTIDGAFPLLIKFLDARENLSVQVHPSPAYARATSGAKLKTECWYILAAEPGSVIYKGLKPGVTREQFEHAVRHPHPEGGGRGVGSTPVQSAQHEKSAHPQPLPPGGEPGVIDLLNAVLAVPGECHNLPSGTVHALGAGVLVAEVQTPSDTTYRLYDWGRAGREMHFDAGLTSAAAAWDADEGPRLLAGATVAAFDERRASFAGSWSRLVTTEFFTLDEARPDSGTTLALADQRLSAHQSPIALIVLAGSAELRHAGNVTPMNTGQTNLIPASIVAATQLHAGESLRVLRATVV